MKSESNLQKLKIYPNPFSDKTIIEFDNSNHTKYDLIIRDLAGKIVYTVYEVTNSKIEITANKLNEGYYIVELRPAFDKTSAGEGEKLFRGKLMVE